MSNELKDIADRLSKFYDDGWVITQAAKQEDGSWLLTVQPIETDKVLVQEATNDNN